jgi:hypothetical protein
VGKTAESAYWTAISTSEKMSDFENYLAKYPNGKGGEELLDHKCAVG